MKLFYLIFHVFIFLFGLILVISPPSLLNYFTKRDMENTHNPYKETLLKNKKICMVWGFYCIGISLLSFFVSNIIMIIISYIVIPIVGLYILENKLK